eukprot:TRINITY_DN17290_c0_g1_i2.p2 TRINITY_DN17290_c0_g1~~TRINITY_DN17290_c0_g1_i2.p2  ORF type:complete len:172 (+),score=5.40 TRINITY_DN17290_c0_g1_i2:276-791(+)
MTSRSLSTIKICLCIRTVQHMNHFKGYIDKRNLRFPELLADINRFEGSIEKFAVGQNISGSTLLLKAPSSASGCLDTIKCLSGDFNNWDRGQHILQRRVATGRCREEVRRCVILNRSHEQDLAPYPQRERAERNSAWIQYALQNTTILSPTNGNTIIYPSLMIQPTKNVHH